MTSEFYKSKRDYGEHDVHQGRIPVVSEFYVSEEGNPTGGMTAGAGFEISWQNGVKEPNGAILEDLIEACKQRLQFFQDSKFECFENEQAIYSLNQALHWLEMRTKARRAAGKEGTYKT